MAGKGVNPDATSARFGRVKDGLRRRTTLGKEGDGVFML
jgi:hypothetical protein